MAAVWQVGLYMDNLKKNLTSRLSTEGMGEVEVFTGPPGMQAVDTDMEFIALGVDIETSEEPAALGQKPNRNEEVNTMTCALAAWDVVGDDGEEAAIRAARERGLKILALVETEVRKDHKQGLTETVRHSWISRKSMDQGVYPDRAGRICLIEFDITLAVRTSVG